MIDNKNTGNPDPITRIHGIEIPKHLIRTPKRMLKVEEVALKRQSNLTVVLENVHDPHNISACIRSCDAVGIAEIHVVYSIAPKPYGRLGKKTSAGSVRWVKVKKWKDIGSCYDHLKKDGYRILTTALGSRSESLYDLDLTQKTALVFGNEHDGVSKEAISKADGNYNIPQLGMIGSLNISVACAVSLFEAMRQKQQAGHYQKSDMPAEQFKEMIFSMLER